MKRVLINFVLPEDLSERFLAIMDKVRRREGTKPPNNADLAKALMGYDPWKLVSPEDRAYFAGASSLHGSALPDLKRKEKQGA